jgi:phage terminase Nu1 subunit (DNA packaging protein)
MKPTLIKSPLNELKQIDIAALFCVTDRTVRNWDKEGLPGKGEGRARVYNWPEVLAWRDARISGSRDGEERTDKQRKDAADANIREMEEAKMAGNLLEASEVTAAWNGFLGRLKANLDGLPDRAADLLEDGMNLAERAAVIRRELNTIRRDLVAEVQAEAGEVQP